LIKRLENKADAGWKILPSIFSIFFSIFLNQKRKRWRVSARQDVASLRLSHLNL
jgi:hypothetical protein